jgi:DNA-binding response OmpR family regulator/DNA-binding CsgD family transcriptional regulator
MVDENNKIDIIKILIADDEPINIQNLFDALASENYQIFIASNGNMAVQIAINQIPDAIIMDWDMPLLNGIEAVKILRKTQQTKDIPIIMATGKMTTVVNLKTALEAGANDYIRKPFDNIEIIARVKSMVKLNIEHKKNIELEKEIYFQKIKAINEELERNKKSLTSITLKLIQGSELNIKQMEDLIELKNISNDEGKKIINQVICRYRANSKQKNWEEFEILFEKVHKSFYDQIIEKYPDLTANERKICAFIKLNMSSKDISAITFQSEETLKKARYRLRKKFEIEKETNLVNFIQNI